VSNKTFVHRVVLRGVTAIALIAILLTCLSKEPRVIPPGPFASFAPGGRLLSYDERAVLIGGDCNNHKTEADTTSCVIQPPNPMNNCKGITGACLISGLFQCVEIRLLTHSKCVPAEGWHCSLSEPGRKCAEHYSGTLGWNGSCLGRCTSYSYDCSNIAQKLGQEGPCSTTPP
jgi:hypothetical protein